MDNFANCNKDKVPDTVKLLIFKNFVSPRGLYYLHAFQYNIYCDSVSLQNSFLYKNQTEISPTPPKNELACIFKKSLIIKPLVV